MGRRGGGVEGSPLIFGGRRREGGERKREVLGRRGEEGEEEKEVEVGKEAEEVEEKGKGREDISTAQQSLKSGISTTNQTQ